MSRRLIALLAVVLLPLGACEKKPDVVPVVSKTETAPPSEKHDAPRRIVLFIGDGMGVGHLTAASYVRGTPLDFLTMPHLGFMTTHGHEFLTTDSAAAATAISTGRKTHYEGVAVVPGTTEAEEENPANHMQTLLELASEHGLRTGMVATSRITHATPAAFAAHRFHRHQYEGVAEDYARSDLDVLIGSGWRHFEERADDRNLLEEMKQDGWHVAKSPEQLEQIPSEALRVAALMGPKDMPFIGDEEERPMQLPQMVSRAIELLDRAEPKGWVLMVEGSYVDWCGHDLDGACAAVEAIDFDRAVSTAREYADERDDTLVVVTSDHETGGLAVIDPYYAERFAKILGGEEEATKLAALRGADGEPDRSSPPFQHVEIGSGSATLKHEPLPEPENASVWGMPELVDGRATLVHGHFSMGSRPLWQEKGRFYAAHSPVMVSTHAEGPGAQRVVLARDNADLGRALRELIAAGGSEQRIERPIIRQTRPKNVILMIGDGMGLTAITGAHYWGKGLQMLTLPHQGLVATHSVDYLVNDSAASATAIATGHRTRKKAVGKVWIDGEFLSAESVLERAEKRGLSTGILTTTPITHATPAAFYAHRDERYDTAGILDDLATLASRTGGDGIELLIGGGAQEVDEATRAKLVEAGYDIATSWPTEGDKIIGLLGPDGLAPAAVRMNDDDPSTPTLAELTDFALGRLASDDDGFLLVVEGGQIDWLMHRGVRDASIFTEVIDFDQAVVRAVEFASERDDTLVIVTADHDHTMSLLDNHYAFESGRCGVSSDCGGPFEMMPLPIDATGVPNTEGFADSALQGNYGAPRAYVQYAWPIQEAMLRVDVSASHSANFVPIFATGPWAHRLQGFIDQPQIGQLLLHWLEP